MKKMSAVLFALIALSAAGALAQELPPQGPTPYRSFTAEFGDFTLCELDRRTHKELSPCIPAVVPGDIFTDLTRAGRIKDPYFGDNVHAAQWVDERLWRYQISFIHNPPHGRRLHLLFMGIDYDSRVFVNGKLAALHIGMFSRVDLDITDLLKTEGPQEIRVVLKPPVDSSTQKIINPLVASFGSSEFGRRNYLKTQMSFDWDFAPKLRGAGLWDSVYLYETGPAAIRDVFVQPHLDGRLEISVELQAPAPAETTLKFTVTGETFEGGGAEATVTVPAGARGAAAEIKLDCPRLWWPWDMGAPDLYRLTASLVVNGQESDRAEEVFGVREISWGPNPDAPEGSADWVLFVNGKREFMRGANWVPPEAMYGRMTDERYGKLVVMAKEIGVNLLRVWGGGNRECRAFYDYCDRAGVMVWQEFPYACVYLVGYPRTRFFKDLSRQEVAEMVRQLRNHPSVMMWCGGNEFNAKQNKAIVDVMARAVAELDPTRRFIPASPFKGDSHNWVVWHSFGNLDDYFDDISPLPSEFGLQAFPARSTLEKWLPKDKLWPVNDLHVLHDLGWAKMKKYLAAVGPEDTLDATIEASQLVQAHYLQRGIENWRQRKYATSGTAFWQLNEPWPCICWSVIDYELKPKLAYERLRHTYNPLLVSARYDDRKWGPGDEFKAEVVVVNDLHRAFPEMRVTTAVCGADAGTLAVSVPEDGVARAGMVSAKIPTDCLKPELTLKLEPAGPQANYQSSENRYLLWIYDPKPAGKTNRNLERIGKVIMSGAAQNQWKRPE